MMQTDVTKIADNKIADIQAQVRQKHQEAAAKAGLQTGGLSQNVTEEDLSVQNNNELIFYSDLTDYKTYRFNGRIDIGDNHLGTNFDMVV